MVSIGSRFLGANLMMDDMSNLTIIGVAMYVSRIACVI